MPRGEIGGGMEGKRRFAGQEIRGWLWRRTVEEGMVKADGSANQTELARRLGLKATVVNRWFVGENVPSQAACDKLAELFGASTEFVMRLAGWLPPVEQEEDPRWTDLCEQGARLRWTDERYAAIGALLRLWRQTDLAAGISPPRPDPAPPAVSSDGPRPMRRAGPA